MYIDAVSVYPRQEHCYQKHTTTDKQAIDQTDRFQRTRLYLGRHSWLVLYRVRDVVTGKPSFTFRPVLPCVTFRDAGLKLIFSVSSRCFVIVEPEAALRAWTQKSFEESERRGACISAASSNRNLGMHLIVAGDVLILASLRHSLTLARVRISSLRKREVEKTDGGMDDGV